MTLTLASEPAWIAGMVWVLAWIGAVVAAGVLSALALAIAMGNELRRKNPQPEG